MGAGPAAHWAHHSALATSNAAVGHRQGDGGPWKPPWRGGRPAGGGRAGGGNVTGGGGGGGGGVGGGGATGGATATPADAEGRGGDRPPVPARPVDGSMGGG